MEKTRAELRVEQCLEAIRDSRKEEAQKAMRRHIGRSMENMLARYPED